MKPIKSYLLLLVILSIGCWLRVYQIDAESMTLDEVYSVRLSENPVPQIISGLKTDAHPPLYFISLHFWMKLFGNQPSRVRTLSVLFGILSIFLAFKVTSLLFDPVTGLWSSILFALSPFFVQYSQQTRGYTLFLTLILASYIFFFKMVAGHEKGYRERILYVIFTIAVVYTHIYGIFTFLSQILYILIARVSKDDLWRKWLIPFFSVSIAYCLWLPVLYYQAFLAREHFSDVLQPKWDSIIDTLFLYGGSWPLLGLLLLMILLSVGGIKERIWKTIFLVIWFVIPVIFPIIISVFKPMYFPRYTIGAFAAFYILAALGISRFRARWTIPITAVVLLIFYFPVMKGYYENPQKEDWRGMVQFVEINSDEGDIIMAFPAKAVIPVRYYYKGGAPTYALNPPGYRYLIDLTPFGVKDELSLPENPEDLIRNLSRDKKRVWVVVRSEAMKYRIDQILEGIFGVESKVVEKRFGGGIVCLFNNTRLKKG